MKVVIVGASESNWGTPEGLSKAFNTVANVINELIIDYGIKDLEILSGQCPLDGIDTMVEKVSLAANLKFIGYPPKENKWRYFRERNDAMATDGDYIIDIEPKGRTKSGGIYTLNKGKELGKKTRLIEVSI